MLISEERMYVLIKKYVPEKYWANPVGPIRSYLLVPQDKLAELGSKIAGADASCIQGLCIDVNELTRRKGKDHFEILVSDDILVEDHMAFVILHEVGHVDWHFNKDRFKFNEGEGELYADFYAYDILKAALGIDRAVDILLHYCSKNGMGKEMMKEHAE